jgi:hypothetical protein
VAVGHSAACGAPGRLDGIRGLRARPADLTGERPGCTADLRTDAGADVRHAVGNRVGEIRDRIHRTRGRTAAARALARGPPGPARRLRLQPRLPADAVPVRLRAQIHRLRPACADAAAGPGPPPTGRPAPPRDRPTATRLASTAARRAPAREGAGADGTASALRAARSRFGASPEARRSRCQVQTATRHRRAETLRCRSQRGMPEWHAGILYRPSSGSALLLRRRFTRSAKINPVWHATPHHAIHLSDATAGSRPG